MISVDEASTRDVVDEFASGDTSSAGASSISLVSSAAASSISLVSSAVVSSAGTVAVSEAVESVVVALAADEEEGDDDDDDNDDDDDDDDDDDARLLDSFTLAASSSGSTLGVGILDDFRSDTVIPRTGTFRTASISSVTAGFPPRLRLGLRFATSDTCALGRS